MKYRSQAMIALRRARKKLNVIYSAFRCSLCCHVTHNDTALRKVSSQNKSELQHVLVRRIWLFVLKYHLPFLITSTTGSGNIHQGKTSANVQVSLLV